MIFRVAHSEDCSFRLQKPRSAPAIPPLLTPSAPVVVLVVSAVAAKPVPVIATSVNMAATGHQS